MVMFPLKKKICRLARLGKQPLHQIIKNEGGERFLHPKTSPPHSKGESPRDSRFLLLQATLGYILLSFFVLLLTPTSKYSIHELLAFHWCILFIFWCSKLWEYAQICGGSFGLFSCLICLSWGVVGDGLRPMLYFEAMGDATLPPFSCYSCLNMHPPSARWNAPMTYEYSFVRVGLWDCFIYIGTA